MKVRLLVVFLLVLLLPVACLATEVNDTATSSIKIDFKDPLPASFTSNMLFDRMEKKSETINAIESEVELYDKVSTSSVILRVKSPDKFSITFTDGSSSVYFNGTKLWIYIKNLNECFYHFSDSSPWLDKWNFVTSMFDPKKLFVNLTRNTLSAIFEMEATKREKMPDGDYHYYLKLTPKLKTIFKEVFELGYYEAVFSEKLYLPVKVNEYDTNGVLKSTLSVKSYKMNENVPDEMFEYQNTTKAVLMPISIVVMQKFEQYKDSLMQKLEDAKNSLKNSILNWSF